MPHIGQDDASRVLVRGGRRMWRKPLESAMPRNEPLKERASEGAVCMHVQRAFEGTVCMPSQRAFEETVCMHRNEPLKELSVYMPNARTVCTQQPNAKACRTLGLCERGTTVCIHVERENFEATQITTLENLLSPSKGSRPLLTSTSRTPYSSPGSDARQANAYHRCEWQALY